MAKPFKVFGIGLNRTGTSTLKIALRQMGYKHCRRQRSLVNQYFKQDWAAIFQEVDHYESFDDWPWPLMYRQILAKYGDQARFVLTKRATPEIWINSLKSHAEVTPNHGSRKRIYGHPYPHGVEAQHMLYYEKHNADARRFFAQSNASTQLLEVCWDTGDAWPELAGFLGQRAPDMEFPHVNRMVYSDGDEDVIAKNAANIAAQLERLKS